VSNSVFIIDLDSCTGCYACKIACKDRAGLADDMDLLQVVQHEDGTYPETKLYYRVIHCFHCSDPPCAGNCPTKAISKAENGLVNIEKDKCIGCGKCIKACPFDAIIMLKDKVAHKCDGCANEITIGLTPTCIRACPIRALHYEAISGSLFQNRLQDKDFNDHNIGPRVLYLKRKIRL